MHLDCLAQCLVHRKQQKVGARVCYHFIHIRPSSSVSWLNPFLLHCMPSPNLTYWSPLHPLRNTSNATSFRKSSPLPLIQALGLNLSLGIFHPTLEKKSPAFCVRLKALFYPNCVLIMSISPTAHCVGGTEQGLNKHLLPDCGWKSHD